MVDGGDKGNGVHNEGTKGTETNEELDGRVLIVW